MNDPVLQQLGKYVLLAVMLLGFHGLFAQKDKIAFKKFGVAEGLPEEFVRSLIQDDQGFIWLATQNGIVKYDGYDFKVYQGVLDKSDSTNIHLKGGNNSLIKAADGSLWFGSYIYGMESFDPQTERFANFGPDSTKSDHMPFGNTEVLFEDSHSNIWFFNFKRDTLVLARLDRPSGKISTYPHVRQNRRFNDIVYNFELLPAPADSSIWQLKHPGQLNLWDRQSDTFDTVIPAGTVIPGTDINDTIRLIAPGNDQHFLLKGNKGVYLWDPARRTSTKAYTNLPDKDKTLLPLDIFYAFEDPYGQIWIFQEEGNFCVVDPDTEVVSRYKYGEGTLQMPNGPEKMDHLAPLALNEKGIWFGTARVTDFVRGQDAIYAYYDFTSKSFSLYDESFNDEANELPTGYGSFAFQALLDRSGLLWLGTRPNLYKEDPKTRKIDLFRHDPVNGAGIPNDTITRLMEDSQRRLWVGTRQGLALKTAENTFREVFFRKQGKQESLDLVWRIFEDQAGGVWVGTYGHGLLKLNESLQQFEPVDFLDDAEDQGFSFDIEAVIEDNSGRLWVSVWRRGVYILDINTQKVLAEFEYTKAGEHGMSSDYLSNMYKDSGGGIWLFDARDNDQGLFRYLEEENKFKSYVRNDQDTTALISNEVYYLAEDDRGRLWVGTDGGICLFDPEKDAFYRNSNHLSIPSTNSAISAGGGRLWINTYSGSGLVLIGPGIQQTTILGEDDGLLHNDVAANPNGGLTMDPSGRIWLPSQRGLSVLDTGTLRFNNYFEKDGFQPYDGSYETLAAHDGSIWIGGTHGLNRIDPEILFQKDSVAPEVLITAIGINDSIYNSPDGSLFDRAVSYSRAVTLDYRQKNLNFEFVALHYLRPGDNLYSWKLENYDADWSAPSRDRQAKYTNLTPGEYTFRVRGSNADGFWNEEGASITITINPPWWRTWWAYLAYLILLGTIGYRLHLYQRSRTLEKAQKEAREKELEQAREIKKAYEKLQSTQTQLIHAEKMASLGELTAGIAHEIQNPLNFVNNFSEINRELIEELKEERAKGKMDRDDTLEGELLTDIDQNLEKISHHGKRADRIVKGMLQHSRGGDSNKEPTDLNALADEYLRLAYHGLRARDKSFNATMETDFDASLKKVDVVPQDIGRVLLNLITNAFHAVSEKKASAPDGYEPTVRVSTRKTDKRVEISVRDNGGGIPEAIRDKIFQPFFTTKPTGEGTGLGLSMAYDIVTKGHGGELDLQSKEGEGSTFTVFLPRG